MNWVSIWESAERSLAVLFRAFFLVMTAWGAVIAAAVFVLWDVDFNEARARYERAKLALFGEWDAERAVAVAATGVIFQERRADGMEFVSGWDRGANSRWCYLTREGAGRAARVITLGKADSEGAVRWHSIAAEDAAIFGQSVETMTAAAKRACVLR